MGNWLKFGSVKNSEAFINAKEEISFTCGQEKIVKVGEGDVVWGYYYFVKWHI